MSSIAGGKKRVAIIGGSASGLPTCRWAIAYGFEPVVFEADSQIGGLWRYKEEDTEWGSVIRTTIINTSKEMTAYSDFPFPAEAKNYIHHAEILDYFYDYAHHHDLLKHYRFNHRVRNVKRATDYNQTGRWVVEYTDDAGKDHEQTFDAVAACAGHHSSPIMPQFPGQDKFQGDIIHSKQYKKNDGYDNKVALVVGIGNSALDTACDLSRVCRQVYVATRSGAWLVPKLDPTGYPFDMRANCRWNLWLRKIMPMSMFCARLEKKLQFVSGVAGPPNHRALASHPSISEEALNKIAHGDIIVKPNVESFTPTGVRFIDGTSVDPLHSIVMGTGYRIEFPYLEGGQLIKPVENRVELYKNMYPLLDDKNTFAFIGLIQPRGAILPLAEMSARLFFDALAGNTQLPSLAERQLEVKAKLAALRSRYVPSPRHTIQVDTVNYLTELADMLGCTPQPWRYILTNPRLAYNLLFGPDVSYGYRLRGPHVWKGAAKAVNEVEKRRNPQPKPIAQKSWGLWGSMMVAAMAAAFMWREALAGLLGNTMQMLRN